MTYSEKLQELINAADEMYNESEWLYSQASHEEKKTLNHFRNAVFIGRNTLKKLQHNLPAMRAEVDLNVTNKSFFMIRLIDHAISHY